MEKQSLIKGTLILGIAGLLARFLGVFFRWPLIMLIGDEGIGYYQMSYPLYMFFIAAASGIPVAVSKMVSERNAVNDVEGAIIVLRKALLFMLMMGGGFSLFLFSQSKFIVSFLKWDNKSLYSLLGIAFAPFFISIMSAFRGFFQGMQNMSPTAVSEIIEQLGRVIIGVGLAFLLLNKGIEYSAGGAAFGAAAGGILGGIYLVIKYKKIRSKFPYHIKKGNTEVLSKLLYIAIPISLGATVGTIMSFIDSILVPQKLLEAGFTYKETAILYGQLTGKAFVLINVPLTLSMALCASTVPVIAEAYILKHTNEVINKIELTFKLSMILAVPSMLGLFFMAAPVLKLIFPGRAEGYMLLKYLSLSIPFIIFVQTSTAILQSLGKYMTPVINLLMGCIVKIIITNILTPIPSINIYGSILGTIVGYITACVLNLLCLKFIMKIKLNFMEITLKPLVAGTIMIISVVILYLYVYNITRSNAISSTLSILVGVVIYAFFILILKVFEYSSIKNRFLRYKG